MNICIALVVLAIIYAAIAYYMKWYPFNEEEYSTATKLRQGIKQVQRQSSAICRVNKKAPGCSEYFTF